MVRIILFLALIASLSACINRSGRIPFEGQFFRGSAKAVDRADRSFFEVSVRPVSSSVEGARQAIVHEATKYCIRWYGLSSYEWVGTAPDAEVLPVDRDRLTLRARCIE